MYREGFVGHIYTCPAGIKTQGFGNTCITSNPTMTEARIALVKNMDTYYNFVCNRYQHLSDEQCWAVTSLAMNSKYSTVFKGKFHKALINKQIPAFGKYCWYKNTKGKWIKSSNLLQSRRYELALFTGDTLLSNRLSKWYEIHWVDRIKK